jgi:hypothetical protein
MAVLLSSPTIPRPPAAMVSSQRKSPRRTGGALQAHHILEARHLRFCGYTAREIAEAPAQVLTSAEHTAITTALKKALPTGVRYAKEHVWRQYQIVYKEYPHYLRAIEHYFF